MAQLLLSNVGAVAADLDSFNIIGAKRTRGSRPNAKPAAAASANKLGQAPPDALA